MNIIISKDWVSQIPVHSFLQCMLLFCYRLLGSAEFQLHILWQEKHKTVTLQLKPSKKAGKHDKVFIVILVNISDNGLFNLF